MARRIVHEYVDESPVIVHEHPYFFNPLGVLVAVLVILLMLWLFVWGPIGSAIRGSTGTSHRPGTNVTVNHNSGGGTGGSTSGGARP